MTPIAPSRGRAQVAAYAYHYRTGAHTYPSGQRPLHDTTLTTNIVEAAATENLASAEDAPPTTSYVDKIAIPRAVPSRERGACLTCAAQYWMTDLMHWAPEQIVNGVDVNTARLATWSDIIASDGNCDALFDAESYLGVDGGAGDSPSTRRAPPRQCRSEGHVVPFNDALSHPSQEESAADLER